MTVKIDGTNTVANPAFTGADTDTGLQCGTNEVKLVTGGTARATVDSSGRLLVGTTSGSYKLEVNGSINIADNELIRSGGQALIARYSGSNAIYVGSGAATDNLHFNAGGSERMRLLSSGGLTFNGDTGVANALNDYEEGSWTPTFGGDSSAGSYTYGSRNGTYTKVGRMVTATFSLVNITAQSNGTGTAIITGLPYPSKNNGFSHNGLVPRLERWNIGSANYVTCLVDANSDKIKFFTVTDSAVDGVLGVADRESNTSDVFGMVQYFTD